MFNYICRPHLLVRRSYHAQGCDAGHYNDHHLDVYESFVQMQSKGQTTSTMETRPSVGGGGKQRLTVRMTRSELCLQHNNTVQLCSPAVSSTKFRVHM